MDQNRNYTSEAEQGTAEKAAGKFTKSAFEWMEDLTFMLVLVAVIFTFVLRLITVDGTSMLPNYSDGDRVLVTGDIIGAKQGDVVIINNVLDGPIIKRVIATEGQVVDFDAQNKSVLIDGVPLDDSQFGVQNGITEISWSNYNMLEFPATVPEGCVFVLGDNRVLSLDSRFADVGMIDTRNILGKALFKVFPLNEISVAD